VPATSSWTDAIAASPLVAIGIVVAAVALIGLAVWAARRYLPPPDWRPTLSADRVAEHLGWPPRPREAAPTAAFDRTFIEKVALLSLMAFIFSRMLPGIEGSPVQVALAVVLIIGASTLVSQWLARRAVTWTSVAVEFVVMTAVNAAIGVGIGILLPGDRPPPPLLEFLFLVAVLSLVVVLYDRSVQIGRVRRAVLA
jgi:hypothetical protein